MLWLETGLMRGAWPNQNSKVENQKNELKDSKMLRRAEGNYSQLIILYGFMTTSDTFHTTQLSDPFFYIKKQQIFKV